MENIKEIVENLNEEILNNEKDLTSACVAEDFCCIITAPEDATYEDIHVGIFPKKLNIKNISSFPHVINGCTVTLRKVTIEACLNLILNWGFNDIYGNHSHVCCTDYICMCDKEIICCCAPDADDIKFTVEDFKYEVVRTTPICPKTKMYKLTGKIKPQCNC